MRAASFHFHTTIVEANQRNKNRRSHRMGIITGVTLETSGILIPGEDNWHLPMVESFQDLSMEENIIKKKLLATGVLLLLLLTCACNKGGNSITEAPEEATNDGPIALIANPSAYYCSEIMGYAYQTVTAEDGSQSGTCIMPNGDICDEWEFYSGECGADYSYCAKDGLTIETRSDDQDTYSQIYGVCVDDDGQVQYKISDLFTLR